MRALPSRAAAGSRPLSALRIRLCSSQHEQDPRERDHQGPRGARVGGRAGGRGPCTAMDDELTGLLRFAGGLLSRQYAEGIRDNMKRLKAYIEAGKGPKAK